MWRAFLTAVVLFLPGQAFRSPRSPLLPKSRTRSATGAGTGAAEELFNSEGWPSIKKELDLVPTFCVANKEGQPIQYEVNSVPLAVFYTDVNDAKMELGEARTNLPELEGLDLIPFPMGAAFELSGEGKAVLVPSEASIKAAGAPPGTQPMGQQVPLFACMEIMQEGPDGSPRLPLFLDLEEAKLAMKMALDTDGGSEDAGQFEVVGLGLDKAVQMLASVPEAPAFQFMTPRTSHEHIQVYLGEGSIV